MTRAHFPSVIAALLGCFDKVAAVFLLLLALVLIAPSSEAATPANSVANAVQVSKLIPGVPAMHVKTNADGSQDYTVTLQILAVMTVLTLLPSFLMTMTAFTRIVIVLAILRQALGLQTTPSNQILMGLSLFLTIFIMQPVLDRVNEEALQPYLKEQVTSVEALQKASRPFHEFMLKQTRESDIALFMRISKSPDVQTAQDVPFFVLAPAFLTSELKTAFQIGFVLFIPFLIIDLVVASVLMAMGMMMLSPVIISLPFKIMLFVLVDGWALVIGSLTASFG
ncbi:MAG TPA: flagellar type III secretion system pore protein FliP [Spongiibacteraceae bacterium]|nr:flagellar type III secretion system pore protein FliP [Spongiibacteraceae bacterium]